MPREKYRRWWREYKKTLADAHEQAQRERAYQFQQQQLATHAIPPQQFRTGPMQQPTRGSPPRLNSRAQHSADHLSHHASSNGHGPNPETQQIDLNPEHLPPPKPAPPPPQWLLDALDGLSRQHPESSFVGTRRWDASSTTWQPRIRCLTCANNILYKTDEAEPIKNFQHHFSHPEHIAKVKERTAAGRTR